MALKHRILLATLLLIGIGSIVFYMIRPWKEIADEITQKPQYLVWGKNSLDNSQFYHFNYLLFPRNESVGIFNKNFEKEISKLDRAILISQREMEERVDYFTVILDATNDGYVKRSEICAFIEEERRRNELIAAYNYFFNKHKNISYWIEIACSYVQENSGQIFVTLKALGAKHERKDIYTFKYSVNGNLIDNYGITPDSFYVIRR